MKKKLKVVLLFALTLVIPLICGTSIFAATGQEVYHYYSSNLSGHTVTPEQVGSGQVYQSDVSIASYSGYGTVGANVQQRAGCYVNAIGNKKFTDTFPDGVNIHLAIYKYKYQIQLPVVPSKSSLQVPQATHLMMQYWDGSNKTWQANKNTLEATIYWLLNPWDPNYGYLYLYTGPGLQLTNTGVKVTPDTNWHTFELIADFSTKKYCSMSIDGVYHDLSSYTVSNVYQPTWGSDLSFLISTESMNCYPGQNQAFFWFTNFKELNFSELNWL
jgi:hypothetical protein